MQNATVVDDIPAGARPINGGVGTDPQNGQPPAGATVSFRPVRFSVESIWESPCFWMLLGATAAVVAVYYFQHRGK